MPVSAMGKSARKNNLSSIQTSLICILRNFKETSTYRNQTYVKCFFNIRNVYKSLYFCFFHGFFVIWVFLCNRMVFQKQDLIYHILPVGNGTLTYNGMTCSQLSSRVKFSHELKVFEGHPCNGVPIETLSSYSYRENPGRGQEKSLCILDFFSSKLCWSFCVPCGEDGQNSYRY